MVLFSFYPFWYKFLFMEGIRFESTITLSLIAVLIILGIAIHLIIPNALNAVVEEKNSDQVSDSVDVSKSVLYIG